MQLPYLTIQKLNALYYFFRKFLFSKIYHAPAIFNQGNTNFLGIENLVQLLRTLPGFNQLIHPLSVDFFGKIKFSSAELREKGYFEAILIGELIDNNLYDPTAQYIVFIGGNTTCYQVFVAAMISLHNKFKQDHIKTYIIGFNPPGVGFSPGQITGPDEYSDAGRSIINNLIQGGIDPERICIYGHSLGAAIGARIAAGCQSEGLNIALFADRTMGRLTDVVDATIKNGIPSILLKHTLGNFVSIILTGLARLFKLEIDVIKYFTYINDQHPYRALAFNTAEDEVIHKGCGLMDIAPAPLLEYFERFKLPDSEECRRSHSKSHNKLLSEDGNKTADMYLYQSIKSFFRPRATA